MRKKKLHFDDIIKLDFIIMFKQAFNFENFYLDFFLDFGVV